MCTDVRNLLSRADEVAWKMYEAPTGWNGYGSFDVTRRMRIAEIVSPGHGWL